MHELQIGLITLSAALPLILFVLTSPLVGLFTPQLRFWVLSAWLSFTLCLASILSILVLGPVSNQGLTGLGILFDPLSAMMMGVVAVVGFAVLKYSVKYLDRDPGQAHFFRWVNFTLGSVLTLSISSSLALFFLAWVFTSYGLHRLLTYYPHRYPAMLAAKKKFLISRLGDVLLLGAIFQIFKVFGSLNFNDILSNAHTLASLRPDEVSLISLLLVGGAITKSAQFPFHSWLPDTMDTPTPVSALMHAGIINAGGFLIVRMSPLIAESQVALQALTWIGAWTAFFGCIVMLSQTDIKKSLAYSTIGQMGFMLLQCGLGAFSAAMVHILGHAFYKAYAFLSAGSAVARKDSDLPIILRKSPRLSFVFACGVTAVIIVLGVSELTSIATGVKKPFSPLYGVMSLALAQYLVLTLDSAAPLSPRLISLRLSQFLRAIGMVVGIGLSYFITFSIIDSMLGVPPIQPFSDGLEWAAVVLLFCSLLWLQIKLDDLRMKPLFKRLYVHSHNGFYVGHFTNQLILKLWPIQK